MRTWFSPARWTAADGLVAVAGVVLAVAVFMPWFKATVTITGSATTGPVTGMLIDPPGTMGGLAAHGYLLVALAVALLVSAVIVALHFPGRRMPQGAVYRYFLVAASAVCFVVVIVGALLRPAAWYGPLNMPPSFSVSIDWTYGALIAGAAALLSVGIAAAMLRTDGF
jgi:hypothetical protein